MLWVPIYGVHLFYHFLIKIFYLLFLAMSLGMIKLIHPVVEARSLDHWIPGKVPAPILVTESLGF